MKMYKSMIVYHGSNFLFLIHPFFSQKIIHRKFGSIRKINASLQCKKNKHATHTVTYRSDELVKSQV